MKITTKQYAQALFESVQGKTKNESKKAIEEFASVLRGNNDLNKQEKIIEEFVRIYNREEGIVEAEVVSSGRLEASSRKDLEAYIKKITEAQKVELREKEDKTVLGGIVIKYGDKILDASLKTKLQTLKSELKK